MIPIAATCKMWHSSSEFITADAKVDGWTEKKLVFTSAMIEEKTLSCKWEVKLSEKQNFKPLSSSFPVCWDQVLIGSNSLWYSSMSLVCLSSLLR